MRNAFIIAALACLVAACTDDAPTADPGGGGGYVPPVDQPIQQEERTFASLEAPVEQAVPATVEAPAAPRKAATEDTCGHRECGQMGYGYGINARTGQLGFGFGTGAINF